MPELPLPVGETVGAVVDAYQSPPYGPYAEAPESRLGLRLLGVLALLVTGAALAAVAFLPAGEHGGGAEHEGLPVLGVSHLLYPAELRAELPQPGGGTWMFPAASVEAGGATFVLDSGNNRILKLDASGTVTGALGEGAGLAEPMALATDGERLYIANSMASQVVAMRLDGTVEKTLTLAPGPGDTLAPRPIGIAVVKTGGLAVSDANNHRVLLLDTDGNLTGAAGTGSRAGGQDGFNVPSALTTDEAGNLYVVDTLNGRVVKLSPEGAYVGEFGKLGDTAGSLARPKGVAVDGDGHVFVSDGLKAAVEVFAADGTYLGMIGRRSEDDATSDSMFQAPAGLRIAGVTLYVVDRMGGLVTLALSEAEAVPIAGTPR